MILRVILAQPVFIQHFEKHWLSLDNANLGVRDFRRPGEHPGERRDCACTAVVRSLEDKGPDP